MMKKIMKKIIFTLYVFTVGYYVGVRNIPKGDELLFLMFISFVAGFQIKQRTLQIARIFRRIKIRLPRIEIHTASPAASHTALASSAAPSSSSLITEQDDLKCDFCGGEDVILSGQQITCPKCKADPKKKKKM